LRKNGQNGHLLDKNWSKIGYHSTPNFAFIPTQINISGMSVNYPIFYIICITGEVWGSNYRSICAKFALYSLRQTGKNIPKQPKTHMVCINSGIEIFGFGPA